MLFRTQQGKWKSVGGVDDNIATDYIHADDNAVMVGMKKLIFLMPMPL